MAQEYEIGQMVPEVLATFNVRMWENPVVINSLADFAQLWQNGEIDPYTNPDQITQFAADHQIPEILADHLLLSLLADSPDRQRLFQSRHDHYFHSLSFPEYMLLGIAHGLSFQRPNTE